MNLRKPNTKNYRPERGQIRCVACKRMCTPKEGDWHLTNDHNGQQSFLCKNCQLTLPKGFKPVTENFRKDVALESAC